MHEAAAQFQGMLHGVDVADTVVADVQVSAAALAEVVLDKTLKWERHSRIAPAVHFPIVGG